MPQQSHKGAFLHRDVYPAQYQLGGLVFVFILKVDILCPKHRHRSHLIGYICFLGVPHGGGTAGQYQTADGHRQTDFVRL